MRQTAALGEEDRKEDTPTAIMMKQYDPQSFRQWLIGSMQKRLDRTSDDRKNVQMATVQH